MLALKHEDLVAEREELGLKIGSAADDVTHGSENDEEDSSHRSILTQRPLAAKCSLIPLRTEFSAGTGGSVH
jgi:hypothetical protein